jgi:eukaryotic-like serine/threonine-protein kinase
MDAEVGGVVASQILISGNLVIFTTLNGIVQALDRTTGAGIWTYSLNARLKTAPVVWNDLLFICSEDRNIYAFRGHGATGENR